MFNNQEIYSNTDIDGDLKEIPKHEIPQVVDNLIGRELLLKVSVEAKHIEGRDVVYSVERHSEDKDLIKLHKITDHKNESTSFRPFKDFQGDTNCLEETDVQDSVEDFFKTPLNNGKRKITFSGPIDETNDGEGSISSKFKVSRAL